MGARTPLRKLTDYETRFRCAGGIGVLREEVWAGEQGLVVRYNLAFLLPHRSRVDNGRILGYDNAHGIHERHWMGEAKEVEYSSFPETARCFYREAEILRRSYQEAR